MGIGDFELDRAMIARHGLLVGDVLDVFESAADVKTQAFDDIKIFYNQQRMHSALGHESPADHERAARMSRAA